MDERAFVDRQILREIKQKQEKIALKGSDVIKLAWRRHIKHSIEKEATLHSYKIENDAMASTDYDTHASKRSIRKGVDNIETAMFWGLKNFDTNLFNEEFIREITGKIEPEFFSNNGSFYRKSVVRILGATWTPPYPEKIPIEMAKYIEFIKGRLQMNDGISAVLESSIFAHLHLVRIHPFDDGNGRTARTLQNIILQSYGLPPAVIYAGERHDYYEHLDDAINGWRIRTSIPENKVPDSKEENSFYNYIAGRVSVSLDRLLKSNF